VASAACRSVLPLREAFAEFSSKEESELSAFAISTQGLSPLLARAVDVDSLPDTVADFLRGEERASAARARRLASALASVATLFLDEGVSFVALKGAALAFRDYPDPSLRPMGDLDLLLRDAGAMDRATSVLSRQGWRALFDTPRHRVFAREDERIARPATEDPDNPVRLEVHRSFRLPVLGHTYDATRDLLESTGTISIGGATIACPSREATLRHLLVHAAEDFAGRGLRGIQAYDFHFLAGRGGALHPRLSSKEGDRDAAPLLFAADAIERLFPDTFEAAFLTELASRVAPAVRARASRLPCLRYTRPERGWSSTLLSLIDGPIPRTRFLLRTAFPTVGEVKANTAPDATGLALGFAYARVLARRVTRAFRI
jgi:hypothetical protein